MQMPKLTIRRLMVTVCVIALAIVGVVLETRWTYHNRQRAAAVEYEGMADRMRESASLTGLRQTASAKQEADHQRQLADYYEQLAELSRKSASRPWYEATPIPLPPSLARPPVR